MVVEFDRSHLCFAAFFQSSSLILRAVDSIDRWNEPSRAEPRFPIRVVAPR